MNGKVPRDVEVFHSHPDMYGQNCTLPLSDPDINTILTFNLKKMVAVNSNGEFNSLEITPEFNPLKFMQFQQDNLDVYRAEYLNGILNKVLKLQKQFSLYRQKGDSIPERLLKIRDKLLSEISEINETDDMAAKALAIHKSYLKANQYGLKYETNFSNLLKYDA